MKKRTCFYLEDDGIRLDVFVRGITEEDDFGNYYLEIVSEEDGEPIPAGRIVIPTHLADEFEAVWKACRERLEADLEKERSE